MTDAEKDFREHLSWSNVARRYAQERYDAGYAAAERDIAAWLRKKDSTRMVPSNLACAALASAIETGEHRPKEAS